MQSDHDSDASAVRARRDLFWVSGPFLIAAQCKARANKAAARDLQSIARLWDCHIVFLPRLRSQRALPRLTSDQAIFASVRPFIHPSIRPLSPTKIGLAPSKPSQFDDVCVCVCYRFVIIMIGIIHKCWRAEESAPWRTQILRCSVHGTTGIIRHHDPSEPEDRIQVNCHSSE